MEKNERVGSISSSSSSSFTNDLFGTKGAAQSPAATETFSSIFPPPSTVLRRNTAASELVWSTESHSAGSQVWNKGTTGDPSKYKEGEGYSTSNKERSSIFQERAEPCPLSSSIYYGGQEDMYMKSSNSQTYPDYKRDGGEDDQNGNNSHSASRGNWWQGSLYY